MKWAKVGGPYILSSLDTSYEQNIYFDTSGITDIFISTACGAAVFAVVAGNIPQTNIIFDYNGNYNGNMVVEFAILSDRLYFKYKLRSKGNQDTIDGRGKINGVYVR